MSMLSLAHACSLVCCSIVPAVETVTDSVDLVEVNHFYYDLAQPVFDQVIFYEWSEAESRFQIRAWRLVKKPAQLPTRNWETGGYQMIWNDGTFIRQVHAAAMRETWTQYDPEMRERSHLPKEERRELLKPQSAYATDQP